MELDVNNTFSNFGKINRKVLNDEISIYYDSREWVTEPWIESEGNILFLAGSVKLTLSGPIFSCLN